MYYAGLDPASVGFPLESPETTLDRSDAVFVDIIHTDIAYITQTGHSDFYPNGGVVPQPGCTGRKKIYHCCVIFQCRWLLINFEYPKIVAMVVL